MWSGDVKTQKASDSSFGIISMSLCTAKMRSHSRWDNRMRTQYCYICRPSATEIIAWALHFLHRFKWRAVALHWWKSLCIFFSYKFERTEVYRAKGIKLSNGEAKTSTEAAAERFPFFNFLFYTWNSISFKRCFIVQCALFESRLSPKSNLKTFRRLFYQILFCLNSRCVRVLLFDFIERVGANQMRLFCCLICFGIEKCLLNGINRLNTRTLLFKLFTILRYFCFVLSRL